jgi:hypothetical protein
MTAGLLRLFQFALYTGTPYVLSKETGMIVEQTLLSRGNILAELGSPKGA